MPIYTPPPGVSEESDPIFSASAAFGISAGDIADWNAAYGWGDHAGLYDATGTAAAAVSSHESSYDHSMLHAHLNMAVLDGIGAGDVTDWDAAKTHSDVVTGNPHGVNAGDIGAYSKTESDAAAGAAGAKINKVASATLRRLPKLNAAGELIDDTGNALIQLTAGSELLIQDDGGTPENIFEILQYPGPNFSIAWLHGTTAMPGALMLTNAKTLGQLSRMQFQAVSVDKGAVGWDGTRMDLSASAGESLYIATSGTEDAADVGDIDFVTEDASGTGNGGSINFRTTDPSGSGIRGKITFLTDELDIDSSGNMTLAGNITANNLSGTNTGDEIIEYAEDLTEESISGTTGWQDKVTKTWTAAGGTYEVTGFAVTSVDDTTILAGLRIDVDGSAQYAVSASPQSKLQADGAYTDRTVSAFITIASGSHTVKLQYNSDDAAKTVYIRDANIVIRKVS